MSAIIFLSFLIIFLSLMLMIDLFFYIDFKTMRIILVIKLYRIKIIKIEINLLTLNYKINNGKLKKLKLILKKDEKYLISQIKSNILNKLYYDSVSLDIIINLISPSLTANVIGVLNILAQISNFVLLSSNEDIDVHYNCQTNFNKLNNQLNLNLRVYFTIFDMVYAIILSLYRRGKYVKEKR